ncbi:Septum-promoting GTP-binding protein 1 [Galdieria sulphuraria]|nr:Septum-promoting GTP-binding protein 1 [Galdieria sulphuraria]
MQDNDWMEENNNIYPKEQRNNIVVKTALIGDPFVGKTSLMVKYVEGKFDEDYIQTLGVNFMEKNIYVKNLEITFSIWDLGGQKDFVTMLPLALSDTVAIVFMFDLTRKITLQNVKEWYRQSRIYNKSALPFLVGTKFDGFITLPKEEQITIIEQSRKFARAMKAPLIFSSASHSINVQKLFKVILAKLFDLRVSVEENHNIGEPLLELYHPSTSQHNNSNEAAASS